MFGPGKYAAACNQAMVATEAKAVILVVLGGKQGNGFEVHGETGVVVELPPMLRHMADTIEEIESKTKNQ